MASGLEVIVDPVSALALLIQSAVASHPDVIRLDGGPPAFVATPSVGDRVAGVRVTGPGEPVEVCVVIRLSEYVPDVAAGVRRVVRQVAGDVPVDVTVSDVEPAF